MNGHCRRAGRQAGPGSTRQRTDADAGSWLLRAGAGDANPGTTRAARRRRTSDSHTPAQKHRRWLLDVPAQVKATPIPGKNADHQGIKVQLIGQIELASDRGHPHDFVSLGAHAATGNVSPLAAHWSPLGVKWLEL